jgi:hypothetical protein
MLNQFAIPPVISLTSSRGSFALTLSPIEPSGSTLPDGFFLRETDNSISPDDPPFGSFCFVENIFPKIEGDCR